MDTIFHNTDSFLSVVHQAKVTPRRYDKNGELLISYEETEEHRRSSVAPQVRAAAEQLRRRGGSTDEEKKDGNGNGSGDNDGAVMAENVYGVSGTGVWGV